MIKYTSQAQLNLEFDMPFGGELEPSNRWVIMSSLVDWDAFAREYYKNFRSKEGRTPIDARVVLGAVIIKHYYCLSDIETIEMIKENPYLQYFIGYKQFSRTAAFDPSLFVSIRKRMGEEIFEALTNSIMQRAASKDKVKRKTGSTSSKQEPSVPSDLSTLSKSSNNESCSATNIKEDTSASESEKKSTNNGKLQIDATVADANIKYPTDLGLLNDARLKSEELTDFLCGLNPKLKRPRTYRRVARKAYLNVAKKKKKSKKELRSAIRLQLNYLERNIRSINKLLDDFDHIPFDRVRYKYFFVIGELARQQRQMYDTKTHSIEHRIVSIHQPHVRPIVRGKAKNNTEFGNKVNVCLDNGIAYVHRFSWEAYNEGEDLPSAVEDYKRRWGYYPDLLQVDKIYLTKKNRQYLKERGIRHSGDPLGRKPKREKTSRYQKEKHRREAAERNQIEGKFGLGKVRYALDRIRAKLTSTSLSWINAIFLVMNLATTLAKFRCALFFESICRIIEQMLNIKKIVRHLNQLFYARRFAKLTIGRAS